MKISAETLGLEIQSFRPNNSSGEIGFAFLLAASSRSPARHTCPLVFNVCCEQYSTVNEHIVALCPPLLLSSLLYFTPVVRIAKLFKKMFSLKHGNNFLV